ncbi:MAG: plasmid stabilization protein [Alphaproteobacteria bacterium]|nr:plasmid stabilization protein [Alphaproteobacteria bacterium]
MAKPQLSVRSVRARELAYRLARRENRSIADLVERALEAYEIQTTGREPAASFYRRISTQFGADIDLQSVLDENRKPHEGIEL